MAFFKRNKDVVRNNLVTKSYSFQKDDVTLTFSLHVDNKRSLTVFEEILIEALAEVREDLEKHA